MTPRVGTIIFPVTDLTAAKSVFTSLLGVEPATDAPYYVGYETGTQHVGLDPNGHREGATMYWHVEDIAKSMAALIENGATEVAGAKDVGGGRLIGSVKDADGNIIGLLQDRP